MKYFSHSFQKKIPLNTIKTISEIRMKDDASDKSDSNFVAIKQQDKDQCKGHSPEKSSPFVSDLWDILTFPFLCRLCINY